MILFYIEGSPILAREPDYCVECKLAASKLVVRKDMFSMHDESHSVYAV